MSLYTEKSSSAGKQEPILSLYHLLDPEVLANPYPLYQRLRTEDPVHWDPFLHAWVVTRYGDVISVFQKFLSNRTPTPEQLTALGLEAFTPLARVMVRQMLFLDPPAHGRVRGLASKAFTPRRVEVLRSHIQDITDGLLDAVQAKGHIEVMQDLAIPLPGHHRWPTGCGAGQRADGGDEGPGHSLARYRHCRAPGYANLRLEATDRLVSRFRRGTRKLPA